MPPGSSAISPWRSTPRLSWPWPGAQRKIASSPSEPPTSISACRTPGMSPRRPTGPSQLPEGNHHPYERLRDILRGSAAIPAVFPPVVIDDALNVDGGTSSNILLIDDLRSKDTPRHVLRDMGVPIPRLRYWIIINNRLTPEPRIIQPSWISITEASVDTMIRSSELTTLRLFAEQVDFVRHTEPDVQIELRFVAIPESWTRPSRGFSKKRTCGPWPPSACGWGWTRRVGRPIWPGRPRPTPNPASGEIGPRAIPAVG